jgi:hypothetical protein
MADRPFRSPTVSSGYPLAEPEREHVRALARNRYLIHRSDGGWEIRKQGARRASGKTATQQEAIERARELMLHSGGGELMIQSTDGSVRSADTIKRVP